MVIAASPPAVVATPFVPVLEPGDAVPATALIDQRGRSFVLGGRRDGATIVTFFFTRCREAAECPLTSAKFARLQALLGDDPARLVEITIDPGHDTPAVLAQYGAGFHADPLRWSLAGGTAAAIGDLERRLGFAVRRTGDGIFTHDEAVVAIDPAGRVADTIAGDAWTPADVLAVTRGIERRPADPIAWLRFVLTRGIAAVCGGVPTAASGMTLLGAFAVFGAVLAAIAFALRRAFSSS